MKVKKKIHSVETKIEKTVTDKTSRANETANFFFLTSPCSLRMKAIQTGEGETYTAVRVGKMECKAFLEVKRSCDNIPPEIPCHFINEGMSRKREQRPYEGLEYQPNTNRIHQN